MHRSCTCCCRAPCVKEYWSNYQNYQDKLLLTQNNIQGRIPISVQSSDLGGVCLRGALQTVAHTRPLTDTKMSRTDVGLLPPPAAAPFFSIFDESSTLTNQSTSCSAGGSRRSARLPLAVREPVDPLSAKEDTAAAGACDELNGIERLSEDAIVTGSYKNKTLCANPEDTCDFNRAAHLASTPFHGAAAQRVSAPAFSQSELKEDSPECKGAPLSQETLVCEGAYAEALSVKKLR
ncbi:mitotic checkpoint serine/threonine-protein kinase BUB1 beta-like [Prinia subflava]|uniref:mitotic checkpoint serine/threonine-protein kinase BUB1 beta-like n=1 Tax=Prinia subflava TaxID=208062 RepID=UPI002FE24343